MSDMGATLGRQQILHLLNDMSDRARRRGVRVDLFLVGGAAMALVYNTERTTRDLDAIFEPKTVAYELAKETADANEINHDWLNDAVKIFPFPGSAIDPVALVFYENEGITVRVASPRYLFAMKAWAGRESDEDDLAVLWPLCGFNGMRQCLDFLESSYPDGSLSVRTQYIVEDLSARLAHDGTSYGKVVWVPPHTRNGRAVRGHWRRLVDAVRQG